MSDDPNSSHERLVAVYEMLIGLIPTERLVDRPLEITNASSPELAGMQWDRGLPRSSATPAFGCHAEGVDHLQGSIDATGRFLRSVLAVEQAQVQLSNRVALSDGPEMSCVADGRPGCWMAWK